MIVAVPEMRFADPIRTGCHTWLPRSSPTGPNRGTSSADLLTIATVLEKSSTHVYLRDKTRKFDEVKSGVQGRPVYVDLPQA
jgi:hypothetical protein